MTDPIITTTRVSDKPVRWCARFYAYDVALNGDYTLEVVGYGSTPSDAQASAAANLDRLKMRMLVASLAFKNRVPETESASK